MHVQFSSFSSSIVIFLYPKKAAHCSDSLVCNHLENIPLLLEDIFPLFLATTSICL